MRLGFILGFLAGGAIASLLAKAREEASSDDARELWSEGQEAQKPPSVLKQQIASAREAAREAQLEKEAEMLRAHEQMIHRPPPQPPAPPAQNP